MTASSRTFWQRLALPPQLTARSAVAVVGLGALWGIGPLLRDRLITPYCVSTPTVCTPESVPLLDRMGLGLEWSLADGLSYLLQNISIAAGPLAALALAFLAARPAVTRTIRARLRQAGIDTVVWGLCVITNGAINEWVRVAAARPRPFVYKDPQHLGALAAHYTSFYSGHTSFVAASWTAIVWMVWSRTRSTAAQAAVIVAWALLPALTAYFRVFAGRHFLSDTLAGGIMGVVVATVVTLRTRFLPHAH